MVPPPHRRTRPHRQQHLGRRRGAARRPSRLPRRRLPRPARLGGRFGAPPSARLLLSRGVLQRRRAWGVAGRPRAFGAARARPRVRRIPARARGLGAALRLPARHSPRPGRERVPPGAHGFSAAAGGRPAAAAGFSGRPRVPRFFCHAVHPPRLEAVVHARTGRVPRAHWPRADVRGPGVRRPLPGDRPRQPRRERRGHRAAGALLLALGGVRVAARRRRPQGVWRRPALQLRRTRTRLPRGLPGHLRAVGTRGCRRATVPHHGIPATLFRRRVPAGCEDADAGLLRSVAAPVPRPLQRRRAVHLGG